jgi:hypothetical protein
MKQIIFALLFMNIALSAMHSTQSDETIFISSFAKEKKLSMINLLSATSRRDGINIEIIYTAKFSDDDSELEIKMADFEIPESFDHEHMFESFDEPYQGIIKQGSTQLVLLPAEAEKLAKNMFMLNLNNSDNTLKKKS